MSCWSQGYPGPVDGTCPECGQDTSEGVAVDMCDHSPVECKPCGWSPCDGSC